jgi:hypothetical protein
MRNPCSLALTFIVLCVIFLAAGCTYETGGGEAQDYAKSFALSGRPDVHIHALDAQVHVITSEDPKVDFHVRYERTGSDTALPFSAHQEGNVVALTWNEQPHDWGNWGGFGTADAVIEVRMPKNADLQLQTSNGAIEVSSLNGNIWLHSSNGAITAAALKGKLKAETSNGAITVDGVDGDCALATSNGRIQAAGRFDSLELHSSNGSVVARAAAGSTITSGWNIGTSNAWVDLSVPTDLKADLNVVTSNGGVQLDLPLTVQGFQGTSQLRGTLNGGGPEVSVHTSNGHIHVGGV